MTRKVSDPYEWLIIRLLVEIKFKRSVQSRNRTYEKSSQGTHDYRRLLARRESTGWRVPVLGTEKG